MGLSLSIAIFLEIIGIFGIITLSFPIHKFVTKKHQEKKQREYLKRLEEKLSEKLTKDYTNYKL